LNTDDGRPKAEPIRNVLKEMFEVRPKVRLEIVVKDLRESFLGIDYNFVNFCLVGTA